MVVAALIRWTPSVPFTVLGLTAIGSAAFLVRRWNRGRVRAQTWAHTAESGEIVTVLAAELRAGIAPVRAVQHLAEEFAVVVPVAETAAMAGDVSASWTRVARAPGRGALHHVAAAWQVAERSGAPLAHVLGRMADATRLDREVDREVQAAVVPARSTGSIMAVLPVGGLLLGGGLGSNPLTVITTNTVAAISVSAGVALAMLGLAWIDRIADRAMAQ